MILAENAASSRNRSANAKIDIKKLEREIHTTDNCSDGLKGSDCWSFVKRALKYKDMGGRPTRLTVMFL